MHSTHSGREIYVVSCTIKFCILQLHNYYALVGWLVGWFGDQGKKGVCVGKKVHFSPMHNICLKVYVMMQTHYSGKKK